jgi:ABC-2 type transport system permease protein
MRNIAAIAQKELKSYFSSPIGYIVVGFWAFLYGLFFVPMLQQFIRQGMQMGMMGGGPQSMNINQQLIRYLMQNVAVLVLFVLPAVTMRTYSEEKKSGTIELLLTSPLTDWEIILGKFLGAMGLYAVMLLVTTINIGILFVYGNPNWKPVVIVYLGLLLLGGAFISLGLFISSLTRNQIVAFVATFGLALMLWVATWFNFAGPPWGTLTQYLSIIEQFDDFGKGVVDTSHIIYYVSFIAFGLFLTAKAVESERWRG